MGRPSKNMQAKTPHPTPGYRDFDDGASMSSAMSLQEDIAPAAPSYKDDDQADDTLPPPYTDDESAPLTTIVPSVPTTSSQPPSTLDQSIECWSHTNWRGSSHTRLSPTLTTDPVALESYIRWEASQIPKAYIRIQGHHNETRRDHDGKNKRTERVDDFDFKADVGDTFTNGVLYRNDSSMSWMAMIPVENDTKTYRGTRIKTHAAFRSKVHEPEGNDAPPTLREWCHLFCASGAPLKTFTLRRAISGRNNKYLQEQITAILRETNYRGNITISFPLHDRKVEVISPHWLNRLRHNNFVWWACVILQLWIITWPLLFLMTKRWEIVRSEYYFSKRVEDRLDSPRIFWKESEEDWCRRWKYTIQQSALSRARGANGAEITVPVDAVEDRQRRQAEELERRNSEQQSGFVGGALALLRGASNIHREMNTTLGWGYDN